MLWDHKLINARKETAFKKLTKAENLESLTLGRGCVSSLNGYVDAFQAARKFYRAAYAWLWTLAARKGKDEAFHKPIFFADIFCDNQGLPRFRNHALGPWRPGSREFESWERDFRSTLEGLRSG
jgi:hypothetical protein